MNNILRIICVLAFGVPVLSRGKKSINLALETSVLFEPQNADKHMQLINEARRFLDTLESAIMPKQALRQARPKQSLTHFISRLADTILLLYEEDLETFFKVLENEMKSQFLKGSIFRDIVYDPTLQTFFRNKLKEWANTDPRQMKAILRQYMARDANGNDTLHELGRFLNDYYGTEQEFKMDEIITRLRSTLDESEISFIIRDALNTLVLQHYDKMNYTTRAKLVEKINTIKHEYFTSHVDHDLKLTFRRKRTKPQDSNSLDYVDAWLLALEKRGAADTDTDLSDVDIQVPVEDKAAPILTVDDWDNWLSKRNMKGLRKINTLMSDGIEEMIKDTEKLKNKHKYKPVKVRRGDSGNYESIDEPEIIKDTKYYKLKNKLKYNDKPDKVRTGDSGNYESIDEPEMIKDKKYYKLKNKRKYKDKPVKVRKGDNENYESIDDPEKGKTTIDFQLGKTVIDEPIDKPDKFDARADIKLSSEIDESTDEPRDIPEWVKITPKYKLGSHENDESKDKPEKVKATADSRSRSNENDKYMDELKKSKTTEFKFRKNDFDLSKDEPEKVKTTAYLKSESNENDESTDQSKNFKTPGPKLERKVNGLNINKLEKVNTAVYSNVGSNENDKSLDKPEKVKTTADFKLDRPNTKNFKSKHKHRHKKRKRKPMKFNADFILGNDNNKVSEDKLKKDKDTADSKLINNRDEEEETEISTRSKGLTTVDLFSQMYGIKPNKELIINKDLEIFVGGFDATLVNKDKIRL